LETKLPRKCVERVTARRSPLPRSRPKRSHPSNAGRNQTFGQELILLHRLKDSMPQGRRGRFCDHNIVCEELNLERCSDRHASLLDCLYNLRLTTLMDQAAISGREEKPKHHLFQALGATAKERAALST